MMIRIRFSPALTNNKYTANLKLRQKPNIEAIRYTKVIERNQNQYAFMNTFRNKYYSSNQVIKKKFEAYKRLCRWHQPIGAMLLYWPTAWGVCIGSPGIANPFYLALFLMGSWTSRSAGCIVNDYFDQEFDKRVERTKSRPLATGQVSINQAGTLLFLNLCGGLYVLFNLPVHALIATMGFVGLAAVYPLAKRYTNYPQLVLGMCFNSGIVIGSLATSTSFVAATLPVYISGIAWTLVYDTVYAYQDIADDLKIGVKSTAVTWKDKNPKEIMEKFVYLMAACHLSLPIIDQNYYWSLPITLACDFFLAKDLQKLNLGNKAECGDFFKKNNMYGALIFLSLFLVSVIRDWRQICDINTEQR